MTCSPAKKLRKQHQILNKVRRFRHTGWVLVSKRIHPEGVHYVLENEGAKLLVECVKTVPQHGWGDFIHISVNGEHVITELEWMEDNESTLMPKYNPTLMFFDVIHSVDMYGTTVEPDGR